MTELIAATKRTLYRIAPHVMPAQSARALNKIMGLSDWDDEPHNLERLEELQRHNESR